MWTQAEAIALCVELESFLPDSGFHVALTGGLLYKHGERKDCDIIIYRIRQFKLQSLVYNELEQELQIRGFSNFRYFGFCVKCDYKGRPVDLLFPEPLTMENEAGYPVEESAKYPDPLIAAMKEVEEIGQS